jgi:hypothetical protein
MTTTLTRPSSLLRAALRLDALVSGANGAAYLLVAGPLADLLGIPPGPMRGVGAFLLVYAAVVWAVAGRPARPAVVGVVCANALWAAGSVLVVLTDAFSPTIVGTVWLLLQAGVVAGFAIVQGAAARRA